MRQRRPRRQLHDPAWNGQDFSRRHHASGDRPTCVRGDQRCRQGCGEPGAGLSKPHGCKTTRPFRSHRSTFWLWAPHRTHQPKIEISIASAWGPRVPSSGTFVRLPAPETLHVSGLAASRCGLSQTVIPRLCASTQLSLLSGRCWAYPFVVPAVDFPHLPRPWKIRLPANCGDVCVLDAGSNRFHSAILCNTLSKDRF